MEFNFCFLNKDNMPNTKVKAAIPGKNNLAGLSRNRLKNVSENHLKSLKLLGGKGIKLLCQKLSNSGL